MTVRRPSLSARRPSIAPWVALALLVFGFPAVANDRAELSGQISAAEHEMEEGYFAFGQEAALVAKPGTALHTWLKSHNGQRVKIVIEPAVGESQ